MYLEMYNNEDYVPLNWDKLATNPDVWEVIKEEIEKKFSADCMMTVITAAKEAGLKDKDIFLPVAEKADGGLCLGGCFSSIGLLLSILYFFFELAR